MANLRQTILLRTDLNLPMGLQAAQASHIHMESIRIKSITDKDLTEDEKEWLKDPYVFIHGVPNVEWMEHYIDLATAANVPHTNWYDTIYLKSSPTQQKAFENVLIGVALGPCDSDKIKAVIGDLPLL